MAGSGAYGDGLDDGEALTLGEAEALVVTEALGDGPGLAGSSGVQAAADSISTAAATRRSAHL